MLREWILGWWSRARGAAADIGARGERAAAEHLRHEKGFAIVQRNWRHGRDEIDLVCRDGEILVFVEVKTRAAHALVGGRAAVNRRKKRALARACRAYLAQLEVKPRTFRFDIAEVEHRDGSVTAVRHFANVPLFAPLYRPGE
jgi:putative endonuclease